MASREEMLWQGSLEKIERDAWRELGQKREKEREEMKTSTIWDIYENPRKGAEHTTALFEWSRNFDYPSPATLFLGLIGWEDMEELPQGVALGYMELDYLGDALKEYASNPQGVSVAIDEMLYKEQEEVNNYFKELIK